MSKMLGTFVELEPADDAVIAEIFGDARFWNAQMIREKGFDGDAGAAIAAATCRVGDGNAQGVAGFDVIVGRHIVVRENENTWTSRSAVSLIEFDSGTG